MNALTRLAAAPILLTALGCSPTEATRTRPERVGSPSAFAGDEAGVDGAGSNARYVFLFIGDGMGYAHVHAAEFYLGQLAAEEEDTLGEPVPLTLSRLPVHGSSATFAANRLITDSAAAGTALACGIKTNVEVLAMDSSATESCKTLAEAAKEQGKRVGIVTSVSLDHATPAAFYAHRPSRGHYHDIGMDLARSPFDYFAGGGFKAPTKLGADGTTSEDVLATASEAGFEIVTTREELAEVEPGRRAIATHHAVDKDKALYYEMDRPNDHVSLAELTERGIQLLQGPEGFFMMIEGGKIDWASHANDARAIVGEVLALDAAVRTAVDFAKGHPQETLIVVTADHETGGLSLGFAGTAYSLKPAALRGQRSSYLRFEEATADYFATRSAEAELDAEMMSLIFEHFSLDVDGTASSDQADDLDVQELAALHAAFQRAASGAGAPSYGSDPDAYLAYGDRPPLAVTLTHIVGRRAGIAFSSYAHSAAPVPVFASGHGAERFSGYYDNTDVAKKLAAAMGADL